MFALCPQSDCQIRLQPQLSAGHTEQQQQQQHLSSAHPLQLKKFRIYLSVARQLDYSISDEMTKVEGRVGGVTTLNHRRCFGFHCAVFPSFRPVSRGRLCGHEEGRPGRRLR